MPDKSAKFLFHPRRSKKEFITAAEKYYCPKKEHPALRVGDTQKI